MTLYVFGWLIGYTVNRTIVKDRGGKTFVTLSVWAYVTFSITLFFVTFITCKYLVNKMRRTDVAPASNSEIEGSRESSNNDNDALSYIEKIAWLLYTVSLTMTFMVTAGYYTAAGTNFDDFDVFALHIHGINLLIMCSDFLLGQVPIHFLHFYFPTLFVVIYLIFTAIYYAVGGTNAQGRSYIYPLLDYHNDLSKTLLLAIVLVIITAIVHCTFSTLALLRDYIATRCNCCGNNRVGDYGVTVSTSEAS